ncbi:hypothetical protein PPYR_09752 [Photinus pyralis]|uniref:F5/8 type C domain-containing protein n=1 Tax=Photinus pyralis TaxID=7054 RepID=A0A5N4AEF2_PHOPY|nr:discoidin domain-containing receptor 2-like [Photinus pyralis]KAB0795691.1 hypothetical protein PPYR_09752 [Photinus pyralis]
MFPTKFFEQLSFAVLLLCLSSTANNELSQCSAPLGMETGAIKDEDITASSSFDSGNVGPQHARVRTEINGGAWCPQTSATAEPEEWLQVDLHTVHVISSVGTQGRFGNGQGVEFTEAYMLEYWRPRLSKWIRYRTVNGDEVLNGNINTYLESKTQLEPPIWATKIRFLPYSYHKRTVCMRVELYGCRWSDGIVSYSMPQGDKRSPNWEFYDSAYDGYWDGGKLKDGLGLLTDGHTGPDDFKQTFYDNSQGWVGWRNDTREQRFVEISFEFDKIRDFTAVHIFANNQFTKDVEVFAKADVMFSIGGRRYKGEPITFDYIEDHIFESPRNVSIKLHHRIGRFVTLRLYFASRWILLSEITFDSDVVKGNFTEEEEYPQENVIQMSPSHPPEINRKQQVTAVDSPNDMGQYLGIVAGLLSVLALLVISVVVFILIQQRRHKHSTGQTQVQNNSEKAALYCEPNVGRLNISPSYADVRDPEYAVPLQSQSRPTAPNLQNIFPKPPPIPPAPERYYAATEICNSRFVPPSPPLSTPPLARLNRQPRYVSTNVNTYVGP